MKDFLVRVYYSLAWTTWVLLIGLTFFFWLWVFGNKGLNELETLRHMQAELEEKKSALLEEQKSLQKNLQNLEDRKYMKYLIHKELGFVEPDEVIVKKAGTGKF